jgi:phosphoglycolate phosphatase
MHFQGVIFDLDGTLLNTLEDIANSANRTLLTHGFPTHAVDTYRHFIGDGVTMLMFRALPPEERSDKTIANCLKTLRDNYSRNWNVNTRPYEGVPTLLETLATKDVRMAVHSNKPADFTEQCVRELLPGHRFEMVLGQQDGIPRKPDPVGALKIAESLGISPSRFLYLGDSAVDMKTASRADMFPVGALWGFRSRGELLENGAKAVINRPLDLLRLLNSPLSP